MLFNAAYMHLKKISTSELYSVYVSAAAMRGAEPWRYGGNWRFCVSDSLRHT